MTPDANREMRIFISVEDYIAHGLPSALAATIPAKRIARGTETRQWFERTFKLANAKTAGLVQTQPDDRQEEDLEPDMQTPMESADAEKIEDESDSDMLALMELEETDSELSKQVEELISDEIRRRAQEAFRNKDTKVPLFISVEDYMKNITPRCLATIVDPAAYAEGTDGRKDTELAIALLNAKTAKLVPTMPDDVAASGGVWQPDMEAQDLLEDPDSDLSKILAAVIQEEIQRRAQEQMGSIEGRSPDSE